MTAPLYVRRLEITNFMRVTALTIDADGKSVIIRGGNTVGKTSALDAIYYALAGVNSKEVPEPIHQGADKALVRLDLGEYVVERHFSAGGSRLVVRAADGSKPASPQNLLNGLLSQTALDPVAFLSRRPQDQVEDVLKVCGVEPPVAAAEEAAGEPHPARPGETADQYLARLAADEEGGGGGLYYVRRREAGRQVEMYRGAVAKQEELVRVKQAESPADVRPVSVAIKEMEQATDAQQRYREADLRVKTLSEEGQACSDNYAALEKERLQLLEAVAKIDKRLAHGREVISGLQEELRVARVVRAAMSDRTAEIVALREEVVRIGEVQALVAGKQQAEERLEGLLDELHKSQAEHGRLDAVLDQLRQLRAGLLEGVDLGVDGLEVGKGELRLHGVSFKQASLAQRLRVACAVAMKAGGQLKLLRIDNGEHLDRESREYLLELAARQGWQVIMTCVADSAELGVEIVDAEAPAPEGVDSQALPPEGRNGKARPPKGKLFDTNKSAIEAGH